MPISAELLDVLVCPVSREPLCYLPAREGHPEALLCVASRRLYRIDSGVPVLLEEESTLLEAAAAEALFALATSTPADGL